jgi:hypothetical protein
VKSFISVLLAVLVCVSVGACGASPSTNTPRSDDDRLEERTYYGYDTETMPGPIGAKAKLPPPHPGSQNITAMLSDDDVYDINSNLSYYTETGMREYDGAEPDFKKLLSFGIDHNVINFYSSRVELAELPDDRFVLYSKVKKEYVLESVKAFFDLSVLDIADYADGEYFGENRYFYRDGYFYKAALTDYRLRWSQLTALYENEDGTYTAYIDNYIGTNWPTNLYENRRYWDIPEFSDDYGYYTYEKCGAAFAVIEGFSYDGYDTFKLIKLVTVG